MFWRRQEDAPKRPNNVAKKAGGAGAALVVMLAVVAPHTALFEGEKHSAYIDKIGRGHPITACNGHTGADIHLGMSFTHDDCQRLLMQDEEKAGLIVAKCSPELVPDEGGVQPKTYLWAAATDFTFNTGYWCKTTMAKLFHEGRNREACRFFNRYIYSGGRPFEGLRRRRADLSALCMKGV